MHGLPKTFSRHCETDMWTRSDASMAQKPSTMSITCMPAGQGFLAETWLDVGVGEGGISKNEGDDAAGEGEGDI